MWWSAGLGVSTQLLDIDDMGLDELDGCTALRVQDRLDRF